MTQQPTSSTLFPYATLFRSTVNAVNDAPVAAGDSYATNEDTALTVSAPGILSNDTDVDSATITAVLVSGPTHGTLSLDANGNISYKPTSELHSLANLTYHVH